MTALPAATFFTTTFGGEPDVIGSAPGRVNLIGEHLDYNGGEVLPIAIERRTQVALRRSAASVSVAATTSHHSVGRFDATNPVRVGHWWDYVAGVAKMMAVPLARTGRLVPQFEAAVWSDVPAGAGLSSSAALEVSTATALAALSGGPVDAAQSAGAAWRAETEFVGVPCGIMDQAASALGAPDNALHVWCDTEATEQVRFTDAVLIFDTGVKRSLRRSPFDLRRAECEEALRLLRVANPSLPNLAAATPDEVRAATLPDPILRRALHVTQETRRVRRAVLSLQHGESIPGELLYESHESLRLLFECSTPELDWFVDHAARIPGIHGARLTGAGWGGCAIAIGERDALERAAADLPAEYERAFGHAARTWITHAAMGACVDATLR
ncbi:MAG TPA: galactokinase [Candidatus Elarobacter sp.]|nr:galactokinase [Candidatus Elarobacter sp.]